MQLKLVIGSPHDVPIQEVIIYIETIPLSPSNPILQELEVIRLINDETPRFKRVGLNMSIFDITKNADKVLALVISHAIQEQEVLGMTDIDLIREVTY